MLFNAGTKEEQTRVAKYMERNIKAPYVHASVSTLGGVARASVLLRVSLDPKSKWANGIFQNSRYFQMSLDRDGVLEQFSLHYRLPKKFRKAKAKSLADAVLKINKYIGQVR
ncbi:hypothetical protein LCGC14_0539720 [marine sediment metagenome]|uniref:Uncharacterized protein n=1 Tax=marine sediment metagenome TaxID=412755 RepID=A0A0F9RT71_9ZZZZ